MSLQDLRSYDACELVASARFVLVNLTGEGLSRAGTDASLCTSTDYALTRHWALAFMRHPQAPRGLAYPSRHNPAKVNYALFGDHNVDPRLAVAKKVPLPDHPDFYRLLDRYDVAGV